MNDILDTFFEDQKHHIKETTLQRYRFSAEKLRPFFGEKMLDSIMLSDIEKYRQERVKSVKVSTINRDMEFLRRFFNIAKKRGIVLKNPVEELQFYREDNIRTRFLSIDELRRLLEESKQISYLHLAVLIAVNTGMRKGEILSLCIPQEGEDFDRLNWVDLKNRCFHLNITKTGKYRNVLINDAIFPHIGKAVTEAKDGKLFPVHSIKGSFESALNRAGIKNAVFHDLRRTFISHAMMAGYSQEVIQRVVGQEDPAIFKRYAHLAPDLHRQVIQEVGRIFMEEDN
ncbi:MAG: tyrosine-type recombinase/integrase [Candidatus Xenobiia bacterium LiM19]